MSKRYLLGKDGAFINISDGKWDRWKADYPGVDLIEELKKANAWLEKNPGRMWKTLGGFQSWLERAYQRIEEKSKPVQHVTTPYAESKHPSVYAEKDNGIGEAIEIYASEEVVQASLRTAKAFLIEEGIPVEVNGKPPCEHVWAFSHYGHNEWCPSCGLYADQLYDNFEYLTRVARSH